MPKPNSLDKLKKQLEKVEKTLEKHRAKCAELEPKWTMRRTRHEINWDYYAQKKMKLKEQIEIAEQVEKSKNNMDSMGRIFNKTETGSPAYWSELNYHETNDL